MTTLADQIIAALSSGHDSLSTTVRGFSPEDLARPSGASEWQVHQVLSHLGSGAEITLAGLRAAQDGAPNPGGDSATTSSRPSSARSGSQTDAVSGFP